MFSGFDKSTAIAFFAILLLGAKASYGQVANLNPAELDSIDVIEHSGETIPLDLTFTDDTGQVHKLADYFHKGKPVILTLNYYECPMLCTLVLNGISKGVSALGWVPGDKYQMLTVSIDPRETWELAANKKKTYMADLDMPGAEKGWSFMVGAEDQSRALADAVGFKYFYDEKNKQYAHPAVIMILTEEGKISRYLYGVEFNPRDLKLGLLEASEGKVGTTLDRIILYCYHYDPQEGGYVVLASNVMKVGGGFTLFIVVVFLAVMWQFEKRRRQARTVEKGKV